MVLQEAELEDRLTLLGYDSMSIPHRQVLYNNELMQQGNIFYMNTDIVMNLKNKQTIDGSILKDDNDIWEDWTDSDDDDDDEKENSDNMVKEVNEVVTSPDPFLQKYSNKPDVPDNRYPKNFKKILPKDVIKYLYYRGCK
jgi:hypothetical protein